MSSATKIVLPLLLLAGAAAGAFYLLNSGDAPIETPVAPAPAPQEPQPVKPAAPVVTEAPTPPPQQPERVAVSNTTANSQDDAPQGVRGRVLLPNSAPAADIEVFLMESSMSNAIETYLKNKSGIPTPPVASMRTDKDGLFALGVRRPGKTYDLRVVSQDHPELQHSSIRVREEDWYDTGDLVLELGLVVQGRVVQEVTNAPIANATVYMMPSNTAHEMVVTPGREKGTVVMTDAGGNFRFTNAPRQGLVNLAAEAPGYAYTEKANLPVSAESVNDFTLELATGLPMEGIVVDAQGKGISNVRIVASALSAKTPQSATTTSGSDGRFAFRGLREGPFQVTASAPLYEDRVVNPLMAGDLDVKLVLEQRAWAKLRVLAANGAPVKSFTVALKRHFPNNPLGIGNVPEFRTVAINPGDFPREFGGDWAVIRGLPLGEFVFQIEERNHAKSLSPSFLITPGGEAPEVEARLTLGAMIQGTVVDDRGQPVANANVTTDMNGGFAADAGGFFEIFRSFMPEKHSKAQVKTDAQGRFRLTRLAFADYMIRVAHPDFCEGASLDIKLETEGQVLDVGVVTLQRGAIVEGMTTVGGEVVGQIKVSVTVPQPENAPVPSMRDAQAAKPQMMFAASAISDNEGRFRLLKRVPPGTYKIYANREAGSNNPFDKLLDMKETERQLVVMPGQDKVVQNFNLSAR